MTIPFAYPRSPHVRRHGPRGYTRPESYRDWLRDEFAFRCVYCLTREVWGQFFGTFDVEHFLPVSQAPDSATDYENLLYACSTCNGIKRDQIILDPTKYLLAESIVLDENGILTGRTSEASRIIESLDLNEPHRLEYRQLWMSIVRVAIQSDVTLLKRILGFPARLPDLNRLRPPGGNGKPEGIDLSHFARRERGELPATY